MLNYYNKYITRNKRKKSAKHQAELNNISKKLKVVEKKSQINKKKMKPYEDKLQPFLKVDYKLDSQIIKLESKKDKILEKYEYEVLNPNYENHDAY